MTAEGHRPIEQHPLSPFAAAREAKMLTQRVVDAYKLGPHDDLKLTRRNEHGHVTETLALRRSGVNGTSLEVNLHNTGTHATLMTVHEAHTDPKTGNLLPASISAIGEAELTTSVEAVVAVDGALSRILPR